MTTQDPAARAIAHIIMIRDELEMAMRPDGECVVLTRQVAEAMLNSLGIAARAVCEREEKNSRTIGSSPPGGFSPGIDPQDQKETVQSLIPP
jgi:hypothetical protein